MDGGVNLSLGFPRYSTTTSFSALSSPPPGHGYHLLISQLLGLFPWSRRPSPPCCRSHGHPLLVAGVMAILSLFSVTRPKSLFHESWPSSRVPRVTSKLSTYPRHGRPDPSLLSNLSLLLRLWPTTHCFLAQGPSLSVSLVNVILSL